MPKRLTKKQVQQITQHRIHILFSLAEIQAKKGNIHLSNRYIIHARKLSMKNLTPISPHLKHQFCKHCYAYFYPPATCTIRIHHGTIIKHCNQCKKITRIPIK